MLYPKNQSEKLSQQLFAQPTSEYRAAPFWAWNCRLDEATLKEQIDVFERMGMGGFFMHVRTGLETPYMNEDFMRCIRACVENAKVPCIQTGTGICHIFVDASAEQDKALDIIENAKASRPSVCNAEEVCLVHHDIAAEFLPKLVRRLGPDRAAKGLHPVELRLDRRAAEIIPGVPAGDRDFDTEFLDYILAVGVVDSLEEAVAHIAAHSTGHSDAIVTADRAAGERFTALVDSAAVYWNVSTRFTDGGEFGLGCEMGISTQKLHARGPMGLEELCTYKYIVTGDGQVR